MLWWSLSHPGLVWEWFLNPLIQTAQRQQGWPNLDHQLWGRGILSHQMSFVWQNCAIGLCHHRQSLGARLEVKTNEKFGYLMNVNVVTDHSQLFHRCCTSFGGFSMLVFNTITAVFDSRKSSKSGHQSRDLGGSEIIAAKKFTHRRVKGPLYQVLFLYKYY